MAITYSNNKGESQEDAIVISGANNHFQGVRAEYAHLEQNFGVRDKDWTLESKILLEDKKSKRTYDKMNLKLSDGSTKNIYFDVTSFFGKRLQMQR